MVTDIYHAATTMLSTRETQSLKFCAQGYSHKEIARLMSCAPTTVKSFWRIVRCKLNARNMTHAVHIAHQAGLLHSIFICVLIAFQAFAGLATSNTATRQPIRTQTRIVRQIGRSRREDMPLRAAA